MMNREDGMGISLSQAPASEGFVRGQRADDVLCTPSYDTDGGSDPELPHRFGTRTMLQLCLPKPSTFILLYVHRRNTSAAPFQDTQVRLFLNLSCHIRPYQGISHWANSTFFPCLGIGQWANNTFFPCPGIGQWANSIRY